MKKLITRKSYLKILSSLLALCLLFGVMPIMSYAALTNNQEAALTAILLSAMENAEETVDVSSVNILYDSTSTEEVGALVTKILRSHPEFFYYNTGLEDVTYSGPSSGLYLQHFKLKRIGTPQVIASNKLLFQAAAAAALAAIPSGVSDFEKVLAAHEYLCYTTSYSTSGSMMHTAYGSLVNRAAACSGYSLAFQYLMNLLGIECMYVSGQSVHVTGQGSAINHGWNLVKINNQWYHVDTTWGSPADKSLGQVEHAFLLVSDATMLTRRNGSYVHIWDQNAYPAATDTTYENLFWTNSTSKISTRIIYNPGNGLWYYVRENPTTKVAVLYTFIFSTKAHSVENSYLASWDTYPTLYFYDIGTTWLAEHNGKLYYNTPNRIYRMNFDGSALEEVFHDSSLVFHASSILDMEIIDNVLRYRTRQGSVYSTVQDIALAPSPLALYLECPNDYTSIAEVGGAPAEFQGNGIFRIQSSDTNIAVVDEIDPGWHYSANGVKAGVCSIAFCSRVGYLRNFPLQVNDSNNISGYSVPNAGRVFVSGAGSSTPLDITTYITPAGTVSNLSDPGTYTPDPDARKLIEWRSEASGIATVTKNTTTGDVTINGISAGVCLLIGEFIDRWGVERTVPVAVVVGSPGQSSLYSIVEELKCLNEYRDVSEVGGTPAEFMGSGIFRFGSSDTRIATVDELYPGWHYSAAAVKAGVCSIAFGTSVGYLRNYPLQVNDSNNISEYSVANAGRVFISGPGSSSTLGLTTFTTPAGTTSHVNTPNVRTTIGWKSMTSGVATVTQDATTGEVTVNGIGSGVCLIIGTFIDRWGMERTIPVVVVVG